MPIRDRGRERPKKQEYETARDLGGRRVPFSGSQRHMPGDVESQLFLVDAKTTDDSYSLNTKTLLKAHTEATSKGKLPLLQIELRNAKHCKKWACIEWPVLLDLLAQAGYKSTDQ